VTRRLRHLRRGRLADRGATVVEYALVITFFVLASMGGANALACSLEHKAAEVEKDVATREPILPDLSATTSTTTAP
jgi:Flp pilus assembly pilin Flp